MTDKYLQLKNDILNWLLQLEDEEILQEIQELKERESISKVCEEKAEYAVKDDFDERFAKGLTLEESKKRTIEFIHNLPWKK